MYRIPFASLGIVTEAEIVHERARLDQAIRLWYLDENWHVPFPLLPL